MNVDQVMMFLEQRWVIVVAAIIALLLIVKVVKTVIKWVLVLAIIAALLFYGANYTQALKDVTVKAMSFAKEEAFEAMLGEAADADYQESADGSFTVTSANLELKGMKGSDQVEITFKGHTFSFKLNEAIRSYIDQSKKV
jgi:hypothetical protein